MSQARAARRLAAVVTVMALASCAQCGPPHGGGDSGPGGPGGARGRSGGSSADSGGPGMPPGMRGAGGSNWLVEETAIQLASARKSVAITTEQVPAWDRFAESVGALIADLSRTAPIAPSMSATQRIGLRVDVARNRYAALENVSDAMGALYAVLSSEQRTQADRALANVVPPLYDGLAPGPATNDNLPPRRDGGGPPGGPGRGRRGPP